MYYKKTLRCGDTLHVLLEKTENGLADLVTATMKKLLKPNGHAVIDDEGTATWISDEEIYPTVWSADGNRKKHRRYMISRDEGGVTVHTLLRHVWSR